MTGHPYVGLRPFQQDESLLFFGRRQQIAELMDRLHDTRFLAIVGSSGCGKSSLIRAGLMPRLEAGFLVENRDRWFFATMTPGSDPLDRLAASFGIPAAALREEGAFAITAHLSAAESSGDHNCFILVDQFEELFRFAAANRDQAADFVQILLSLAAQTDFPVFVAITMRSDFLGECDAFTGLPEALNRSQYFVPRLNRQQRREAVEGPVKLFRQRLRPQLLDRLINDVGDEPGQLPVLQHALLRTWEQWTAEGAQGPLDLRHYESVGGIREALSRDAETALLAAGSPALVERVFRRLTTTDAAHRRIRRPALLGELEGITGSPRRQILDALRPFHARSFVVIYERPDGDHVIDISHESLIAQWDRLKEWVDAEAESKRIYLDLVTAVERRKALLHDADLQVALDWRKKLDPQTERAWAMDLDPAYPKVVAYIEESVRENDRDKRRQKRQLVALWSLGGALLLAVGAIFPFARAQLRDAEASTRYAAIAKLQAEEAQALAHMNQMRAEAALAQAAAAQSSAANARETAESALSDAAANARLALAVRLHAEAKAIEITPDRPFDNELRAMMGAHALRIAPTFENVGALLEVLLKLPKRPRHFSLPGSAPARVIVFSPQRRHLASGHEDGKVYLWSIDSGNVERELGVAPGAVYSLAFDAKGEWLAAGAQQGIAFFSTSTPARSVVPTVNVARSVALHPNGEVLAAVVQEKETIICRRAGNPGRWIRADSIHDPWAGSVFFDANGVLFRMSPVDGRIETLGDEGLKQWASEGAAAPDSWHAGMIAVSAWDDRHMRHWLGPRENGSAYNPVDKIAATPGKPDGIDLWDGRVDGYAERIMLENDVQFLQAIPGTASFLVADKRGNLSSVAPAAKRARAMPRLSFRHEAWTSHPTRPLIALYRSDGDGAVVDLRDFRVVYNWRCTGNREVVFRSTPNRLYILEGTGKEGMQKIHVVNGGAWTKEAQIPVLADDVARIDPSGQRIVIESPPRRSGNPAPAVVAIFDARSGLPVETAPKPKNAAMQEWNRLFAAEDGRPQRWQMDRGGTIINPTLPNGRIAVLPVGGEVNLWSGWAIADDNTWAATAIGKTIQLWALDPQEVLSKACREYLAHNLNKVWYERFRIPEAFRVPACPNLTPTESR